MALLDLFRPPIQHSNPKVRRAKPRLEDPSKAAAAPARRLGGWRRIGLLLFAAAVGLAAPAFATIWVTLRIAVADSETPVYFSCDGSWESRGHAVTCRWEFGDGSSAQGVNVQHRYRSQGTYTARLTVCSPGSTSTCETMTQGFNLFPPCTPVVDPRGPYSGSVGESILFEARGAGCNNVHYVWDFGDGSVHDGRNTFDRGREHGHSYSQAGTFTVRLQVFIADVLKGTAYTTSTIRPPDPPPPPPPNVPPVAAPAGNWTHWSNHSNHRSATNDFQHYFADVNGDGLADWIQVARVSNDGWVGLAAADGSFQHWTNHSDHRGAANDFQHYFADVNGDGRADWIQVARVSNDGWVGLAAADGSFQHWTNHSHHRGATNDFEHYFADVNGDGRADWIQVARWSTDGWVGLAAADGSFQHWTNHSHHRGATNDFEHYFADVNGDGRADWIQVARWSNDGWVGLAAADGSFQHWTNHSHHRGATNDFEHYFADVNGDGRADWIQVARWSNDGWVGLAAADGSFQHWTNHSHHRGATNDFQHYFADVNGDGRADWIQVARGSNDGWLGLAATDGSFEHWNDHSHHRGATNDFEHYFADVNGDGRADWIQVARRSNDGWVGLAVTP